MSSSNFLALLQSLQNIWLLAQCGNTADGHPPSSSVVAAEGKVWGVCELGLFESEELLASSCVLCGGESLLEAVLICCVLCAPGAAASIRGKGGSLPSARNDRCLLDLWGTLFTCCSCHVLLNGASLGEKTRNKGHFKPKKKKEEGGNSKINTQVDSLIVSLAHSMPEAPFGIGIASSQALVALVGRKAGWLPSSLDNSLAKGAFLANVLCSCSLSLLFSTCIFH